MANVNGNNGAGNGEANANDGERPMQDYASPSTADIRTGYTDPTTDTNFELKHYILNLVSQNQFGGLAAEDPSQHLANFMEICNTNKGNAAVQEKVRLLAFPFSLRDRAKGWLRTLNPETHKTWEDVSRAFLNKYFPPSKTARLRNYITSFRQREGESLSEAWERFQDYLARCPHHGLEKWLVLQTFYDGLSNNDRLSVDSAAGGNLLKLFPTKAYELLDGIATHQSEWTNDRSIKTPGALNVDMVTGLTARFDAFQLAVEKRLDSLVPPKAQPVHQVHQAAPAMSCPTCGGTDHFQPCPLTQPDGEIEQVDSINYMNQPQNNNQNWKGNNGNWSNNNNNQGWWNGNNSGPSNQFQPNQNRQPPRHDPREMTRPISDLEKIMTRFMSSQEETNKTVAGAITTLTAQVSGISNQIETLASQVKRTDAQVQQLVASNSRPSGKLPYMPEPNPKEQVQAIYVVQQDEDPSETEEHAISDPSRRVDAGKGNVDTPRYDSNFKYLPYPNRVVNANSKNQITRFMELLRKMNMSIPFSEAIAKIPSYAKFLKEILTNKRKSEDTVRVPLTAQCNSLALSNLPPKLGDPGCFVIPCNLGDTKARNALCDLGASVSLMPHSLYKRLDLGELKPTAMTLQMADRSLRKPLGVIEDVPIRVGKFFIPIDFVVVEMEENTETPLLLGRPFLKTAGMVFDLRNDVVVIHVGDEKEEFPLNKPYESHVAGNSRGFDENAPQGDHSSRPVADLERAKEAPHIMPPKLRFKIRNKAKAEEKPSNIDPEKIKPPSLLDKLKRNRTKNRQGTSLGGGTPDGGEASQMKRGDVINDYGAIPWSCQHENPS